MKYFVVSDIHGHFKELKYYLYKAGYRYKNPKHKIIVCGDIFDRGNESLEVLTYVRRLQRKDKLILVRGNHENYFQMFLEGASIAWHWFNNGFYKTVNSLTGYADHFKSTMELWENNQSVEANNVTYDTYLKYENWVRGDLTSYYHWLLPWLQQLPDYYETEHYIFTHAGIDTNTYDYRTPTSKSWFELQQDDGSFFNKSICNTEKTVVIGHFATDRLRDMYNIPLTNTTNDILVREDKKVIAIDTCTILTKRINVLIIEEEGEDKQ